MDISPDNLHNPITPKIQTYLIIRMIMLEVEICNSGNLFF